MSDDERRGLIAAAVTLLIALAAVAWMAIPAGGVLRGPEGEITPLLSSIVALMLFLFFLLLSAFINLFIGGASAKWAIMAPVFVPMLMLLGFSPELTQAAYRIGDSVTNILTPLLPYYPLVIIFARKYDGEIGLGTLIAAMLPYSVVFALTAVPTRVLWILLGIPLGPGAPLEYVP